MANYMADEALNRAADHITSVSISVQLHNNAPGNSGANNKITGASEDVAANGWGDAVSGESANKNALDYGVLSSTASTTVKAYSLLDGTDFLGWADLGTNVVVAANERFSLQAGTVKIKFARP